MAREPTWEEATKQVLGQVDGPLHYAEIAERILAAGVRTNPGATPAQTDQPLLSVSIRSDNSPFQKVAPGRYILRDRAAVSSPSKLGREIVSGWRRYDLEDTGIRVFRSLLTLRLAK